MAILPARGRLERYYAIAKWSLAAATIAVALWRVLLWQLLDPLLFLSLDRLTAFLGFHNLKIRPDITSLAILASQLILVLATVLLAAREETIRRRRFWLLALPLVAFLLVAGLSKYWSIVPETTVKRMWFLAAVTFGGVFIGLQFRRGEILRLYEILSVLLILGSYALLLRYPEVAIDYEYDVAGAWRGLLKYKGHAGTILAFAAMIFLLRLSQWRTTGWTARVYAAVFLALALTMVVRAMSATGQIALLAAAGAFAIGLVWIRWRDRLKPLHYRAMAAGGAILLIAIVAGAPPLLKIFGRNVNLTGRLPLWQVLLQEVRTRPALGWGFGEAFWQSSEVERVWETVGWTPGTAHSGFVEVLLDTGMAGFAALVLFVATTAGLVVRYIRRHAHPESLIFASWIVVILLVNVGENLLASYELFFWLALVVTFAHTAKDFVAGRSATGQRSPMRDQESVISVP